MRAANLPRRAGFEREWSLRDTTKVRLPTGGVMLPVIALYTAGVYWMFRGKVQREAE